MNEMLSALQSHFSYWDNEAGRKERKKAKPEPNLQSSSFASVFCCVATLPRAFRAGTLVRPRRGFAPLRRRPNPRVAAKRGPPCSRWWLTPLPGDEARGGAQRGPPPGSRPFGRGAALVGRNRPFLAEEVRRSWGGPIAGDPRTSCQGIWFWKSFGLGVLKQQATFTLRFGWLWDHDLVPMTIHDPSPRTTRQTPPQTLNVSRSTNERRRFRRTSDAGKARSSK